MSSVRLLKELLATPVRLSPMVLRDDAWNPAALGIDRSGLPKDPMARCTSQMISVGAFGEPSAWKELTYFNRLCLPDHVVPALRLESKFSDETSKGKYFSAWRVPTFYAPVSATTAPQHSAYTVERTPSLRGEPVAANRP